MREIKFRAWNETEQKMVRITILDFTLGLPKYLMQYTGLNDKNGKEIYEGDILKMQFGGRGDEFVISIHWDITGANWQFNDHTSFDDGVGLCEWDFTLGIAKHSEVIGNIWENKELLT